MRVAYALPVLLLVAGCGRKEPAPKEAAPHAHVLGPHTGEVLDLADGYHLEILHDHDGGHMSVWVLGADAKTSIAIPRPVVNLTTKSGPVEVTLAAVETRADGTSDGWKGSHEGLKADPWDGRIRVVVAGKTYQSALEGPAHTHE